MFWIFWILGWIWTSCEWHLINYICNINKYVNNLHITTYIFSLRQTHLTIIRIIYLSTYYWSTLFDMFSWFVNLILRWACCPKKIISICMSIINDCELSLLDDCLWLLNLTHMTQEVNITSHKHQTSPYILTKHKPITLPNITNIGVQD